MLQHIIDEDDAVLSSREDVLAIDRSCQGRQFAIVCHGLSINELWVFTEEARHSIDHDTASVSADNQILDQIVRRDYLKDVIEAESLLALSKLIPYRQTTCLVFSVKDTEKGAHLSLLAHSDKLGVIRVIMRHKDSAFVAEGTAVAQVTKPLKVLQVKPLHSAVF